MLTLRADCSLVTLKSDHSSRLLPRPPSHSSCLCVAPCRARATQASPPLRVCQARSGSSSGLTIHPPLRASPCGQGSPPDFRQDNSQTLSLYGHLEIRPVTLRAAKGLARRTEILRCAQDDSQGLRMTARTTLKSAPGKSSLQTSDPSIPLDRVCECSRKVCCRRY